LGRTINGSRLAATAVRQSIQLLAISKPDRLMRSVESARNRKDGQHDAAADDDDELGKRART
jgi:hypothetical protein